MRTKSILSVLVALLLLLPLGQLAQAQVHTEVYQLSPSSGNYFQLINSAGDSTYTTKIPIVFTQQTTIGNYDLYPDSMALRYYSSNDSVISVNFGIRMQYNDAAPDTGLWTLLGVDTATTASHELQRRGYISITRYLYTYGTSSYVNISIKAAASGNCTGNAALGKKNAAKLYVKLVMWYTLVK